MKLYHPHRFAVVLLCTFLGILFPLASHAEMQTVEITIQSKETPTAAIGLLFDGEQAMQVTTTEISQGTQGHVVVSFPFDDEQVRGDTMASAFLVSDQGSIAFGSVKSLYVPGPKDSYAKLPLCVEKKAPSSLGAQMSLIENLVKIRTELREKRQQQLREVITDDLMRDLRKAESVFGLQRSDELDLNIDPAESVDRLSRIHDAIRSHRIEQEKKISEQRQ